MSEWTAPSAQGAEGRQETEGSIRCTLCFRRCSLKPGQKGWCKVRQNQEGTIVSTSYGKLTSLALDPIEKKPLARFFPGSLIVSAGSYGCSLACSFCQNWQISQQDLSRDSQYVSPQDLVEKAVELVPYGNIGIAATYNEPLLNLEYWKDVFQLAKEKGLKTVMVTSGNATLEALEQILPYTDAFNIDLKGFSQDFYDWVSGDLETVKACIERAAKQAHVELTTLVVPGKNDDPQQMEKMAAWIASIDPEIPLHLSRYFPRYQCSIAMTPIETLKRLEQAARKHLHHVYLGNV